MTYYVDVTGGSDTNSGTSMDQAWQTINKVNNSFFAPGDFILFKRGAVWREELNIKWSGIKGSPITFADYGSGALPVIHGGTIIPPESWAGPDRNGVYSYSYSANIRAFAQDNIILPYASSSTLSDGNWYLRGGNPMTIYYKPTSGTPGDHITDMSILRNCIRFPLGNNSFVTIRNLNLSFCLAGIIGTSKTLGLHDIIIENSQFDHNPVEAIILRGANGYGLDKITIGGNTIINSNESIFIGAYSNGPEKNTNIVIDNNKILDTGYMVGTQSWSLIIPADREGIGLQNIVNSTISRNEIAGGAPGGGIVFWNNAATVGTTGNQYLRNYIHDILGNGIIPGGGEAQNVSSSLVAYNIIENCGQAGLRLNLRQNPSTQVYNNIVKDCAIGINMALDTYGYVLKNNIVLQNTGYLVYRGESGINNNILDKNLYYSSGSAKFYIKADKDFTGWKSITGQDSNSTFSDPSFISGTSTKPYPYFYPNLNSPVIDAGIDVGLIKDYLGVSVLQTAAPDIGAFEYTVNICKQGQTEQLC